MLLAVDAGNTKIKAAVFEDDVLLERFVFDTGDALKKIKNIFLAYPQIASSILSEVGNYPPELLSLLDQHSNFLRFNRESRVPFTNSYATPATLGIDRIVLAAGSVLQFPRTNRLVIDAGTCVTYDFTDVTDNYLGGAISPGLRLRYEAMHNFTAKLPLLTSEMPTGYIGNSTATSMHSGVVNGLLYEIEGFVSHYEKDYGSLAIIVTGGDAEFLAKRLKNTIFANSNFLLESLRLLYQYSNKK